MDEEEKLFKKRESGRKRFKKYYYSHREKRIAATREWLKQNPDWRREYYLRTKTIKHP